MAKQLEVDDWVLLADAARRVSMSLDRFRIWVKDEGVSYVRRGTQYGIRWADLEVVIARSRLTTVCDRVRRNVESDLRRGGVELLDRLRHRFDWSDTDIAHALEVGPSTVSRWRLNGVPPKRMGQLRQLAKLSPAEVAEPRRLLDPVKQRELSRAWVIERARRS